MAKLRSWIYTGGERAAFRRPSLALAVLVAALAGLQIGCGGGTSAAASEAPTEAEEENTKDSIAVGVAAVEREPLSALYSTSATLRADKRATVTARTRGVVERLAVEEGASVGTGQVLAELENDEQEIAFETARATRASEERELERAESLFEQGLISEEDIEVARREHEAAERAYARAELDLSRTVVRAPFSGTVVTRHLDLGATVTDGTAIYDVADLQPLYADVNVPERHVSRLQSGQMVRLVAESGVRTELEGAIERIAPAVDPETGTVKVTVAVRSSAGGRPGSFVRVEVVTDTHADALVVPRSALVAEGRRWHLFRLAPDGETVEQLDVELGYEEGDRVEIARVAGGGVLEAGDRVVALGASALNDGAPVTVSRTVEVAGDPQEEVAVTE